MFLFVILIGSFHKCCTDPQQAASSKCNDTWLTCLTSSSSSTLSTQLMLSDHRFPNFSALQSLDSMWSSKHPSYCSGSGWAGLGLACWHGWGVLKLKRICNERHLVWLYVAQGHAAEQRTVAIQPSELTFHWSVIKAVVKGRSLYHT